MADLPTLSLFQHFLVTFWETQSNYCSFPAVKLWAQTEIRKESAVVLKEERTELFSIFFHFF